MLLSDASDCIESAVEVAAQFISSNRFFCNITKFLVSRLESGWDPPSTRMKSNHSAPTRARNKQRSKKRYCRMSRRTNRVILLSTKDRLADAQAFVGATTNKFTHADDHSYDTDSFPIGLDNHASYSMTNDMHDFVGPTRRVRVRIKGIAGKLVSAHVGRVQWKILDDQGVEHTLDLSNVYYVHGLPIRLLSPQHLAQCLRPQERMRKGTICITDATEVTLLWNDRTNRRTVKLNAQNVPVLRSAPGHQRYADFEAHYESQQREPQAFPAHIIPPDDDMDGHENLGSATRHSDEENSLFNSNPILPTRTPPTPPAEPPAAPPRSTPVSTDTPTEPIPAAFDDTAVDVPLVDDDTSPPLTNPTHDLLRWHYRLGHTSMEKLRNMARQGDLPKRLSTCPVPTCAACRFGKATKVPWRSRGKDNRRAIKPATRPGQCVSVDQLESTTPGLIAQLKGRATRHRYKYVTVFVDNYSGLSFVYLMKSISSEETVKAKRAFEAYARSLGVTILHYHADNGRFADNMFLKATADARQSISFCGVNAHHQNSIAEKRIRDLQDAARTQLIHAKHRWPAAIANALWPYAIRYANDVHNSTAPRKGGASPIEKFASVKVRPRLKNFHSFGCPVHVLKSNLQSGKTLPKWETRARVGIYLGPSPRHARSVALVLNMETGMVSPQYHVRFDDLFETVKRGGIPESKWQRICHFTKSSQQNWDVRASRKQQRKSDTEQEQEQQPDIPSIHRQPEHLQGVDEVPTQNVDAPNVTWNDDDGHSMTDIEPEPPPEEVPAVNQGPDMNIPVTQTRSGRTVVPTRRAMESQLQRQQNLVSWAVEYEVLDPNLYSEEDRTKDLDDPIAYAMKATSDPDTMYYHQAMKEPDAKQFKEAMMKEVKDHTERKHWNVILKSDVPEGETILPAVWAMRRKRRIATREVYKWKSRLNLGGHKMIYGKHYEETYAPALSWATIRLFLILSIVFGWKTRQIDFVLAYPQADIPRPTFMELPRGVNFPGLDRNKHCLQIKKNVYGGKDSGRTWFLHLKKGLESIGFEQSQHDDCVFYRDTTIFLVYTDDSIILDKDESKVERCVSDLSKIFEISDEGTLEDYLGVNVMHKDDGTILLAQPHLIDSILKDVGLMNEDGTVRSNAKGKETPALSTKLIGPDTEGAEFDYEWNYRSVIGKLNFLEKSTRPDIAYATHQCARFTSNAKKSHGEAVKHIARYLLTTRDKGVILDPSHEHSFDCYVDADYTGNWDKRIASKDPDTAKSRSGYVIRYANAPIYWASKLQTIFALSTSESEYIALSEATRHCKHLMYLLEEIESKGVPVTTKPTLHCKVFEDNSAALEMARVPKMRPRTRHLNCYLHHFRNEVANKRLMMQAVGTRDQMADLLTKQPAIVDFYRHRCAIMGW